MSVGGARTSCSLFVCVCWARQRMTFEEESVGYQIHFLNLCNEERERERERVREREREREREGRERERE